MKQKIINIAVIAHVDAGKSTLVDAFLSQSGVFRANEEVLERVMDSNDLERERGITIYSKNCSVMYKDYKINIVDTPGHADFSSEVERIIKTVDTVILLVDASEGPMPQTRFVLSKALELGLKPILLINKIDKRDERANEVVDMVFNLFIELNASDEQLDFPILYGIARDGIVKSDLDEDSNSIEPLFKTIINQVGPYPNYDTKPLQLQISSLGYDDYIGRLGIGRIYQGVINNNQIVSICTSEGVVKKVKIGQVFTYIGLKRIAVDSASSGDIVVVSGISDISIGDVVCLENKPLPLEKIQIEEPTISMNFLVNKSPFSGLSGKYLTSRHLKGRLKRELEVNVGLKVEDLEGVEGFKVSGRGELHLSILIENMRREGYELAVSKPEVIMHKVNDDILEPIEEVVCNVPEAYIGVVITKLNLRKGILIKMDVESGYAKMEYLVSTRGLLGYRSEFMNDTHGKGTLIRRFVKFDKYHGEIPQRNNGVMISQATGEAMTYSLFNLSDRGQIIITPGTKVYEGMIIGVCSKNTDLTVNPCKNKKLTNMRSANSDEAMRLSNPQKFTLEEALEFINDDELVEITPDDIRLRKKYLSLNDRRRNRKEFVIE